MFMSLQSDWSSNEMEKKADQFADKYGAEYWCTSSRTGTVLEITVFMTEVVAINSP